MTSISRVSEITRAKDWRLSLVPFVIGCIYLWIGWFRLKVTEESVLVFAMLFITTIGFSALGYFINEFFDKKVDAIAGKKNTLAEIPAMYQVLLCSGCVACALLPWLFLPADALTYSLICLEIGLFLLYSLPFPRLKEILILSGITDAAYAYLIPLLLVFYTFSLFANKHEYEIIVFLAATVFFVGFRNITIHQVNDIAKDHKSGVVTLPQFLGTSKTGTLLLLLLAAEVCLFTIWSVLAAIAYPMFWIWVILYAAFLVYSVMVSLSRIRRIMVELIRHLTDPAYQYLFPAFTLFLIVMLDYKWLWLVPLHLILLVPRPFVTKARDFIKSNSVGLFFIIKRAVRTWIMVPAGWAINLLLHFTFRLFGVNLKSEKTDAISYLRKKFF